MLVYLDTWLMSRLAQSRERDAKAFEAFLSVWQQAGCELAVSRTHLYELRRHQNSAAREHRYQLMETLVPGRFDMLGDDKDALNTVGNREILVILAAALESQDALGKIDRYWVGFPHKYSRAADIAFLRQMENPMLGSYLNMLYEALATEAKDRSRARKTRYERSRVLSIPTEKPSPAYVDQVLKVIDSQIRSSDIWQRASTLMSPEQLAASHEDSMALLRKVLRRATQVGLRKAFVENYASPRTGEREYTDTVIQRSSFRANIEEVMRFCRLSDPQLIENGKSAITVEMCPGTWLRDAVEIEMRKSKPEPVANDWFDLDHLTHLPYVDLYIADAEIVNNTAKVLRRVDNLPTMVRAVQPPVSIDGSLAGLQKVIEARRG